MGLNAEHANHAEGRRKNPTRIPKPRISALCGEPPCPTAGGFWLSDGERGRLDCWSAWQRQSALSHLARSKVQASVFDVESPSHLDPLPAPSGYVFSVGRPARIAK